MTASTPASLPRDHVDGTWERPTGPGVRMSLTFVREHVRREPASIDSYRLATLYGDG